MIKLNDRQWKNIKSYIPKNIAEEIELDIYLSSLKFSKIDVMITTENKKIKVVGEKLNDIWSITPVVGIDGKIEYGKRTKVLTHSPSGLKVGEFRNRKDILRLWDKIKDLDIHYEDTDKLSSSKDFYTFTKIVRIDNAS